MTQPAGGGGPAAQVLVVNSGSSSLKYQLVEVHSGRRLATGSVDRIGEDIQSAEHLVSGEVAERGATGAEDHGAAFNWMLGAFERHGPSLASVDAIGHRVVTAGGRYDEAVLATEEVCTVIDEVSGLAPLHNPANLAGIRAAVSRFPEVPNVAVFDTAFFAHLPEAASTYAIDTSVSERHGLRRHGAHGTSHRYVSGAVAAALGPGSCERQVILHLGNGASASAVLRGQPVDTSMGITPLEGLVMGTRSGDVDPALPGLLHVLDGMEPAGVDELLNERSGLLGLCGHRDMRDVHRAIAQDDRAAELALEVYLHRIRKYVGAYAAVLGGIDVLAFTAGVGENDPIVRAAVVEPLGFLGLRIDPESNRAATARGVPAPAGSAVTRISPPGDGATVVVVATDEELAIAREVAELLELDRG